jgi:hypothetical protein
MGVVANFCFLLLALAVFAVWTRAIFTRRLPRHCIINLLGGAGIFALTLSAISPDDDLLQHELIRPASQSSNVFRQVRATRTGSISTFPVIALSSPAHPIQPVKVGGVPIASQRVCLRTLHVTPVSSRPPPLPL